MSLKATTFPSLPDPAGLALPFLATRTLTRTAPLVTAAQALSTINFMVSALCIGAALLEALHSGPHPSRR